MPVTLGISFGTCTLGVAVVKNGELVRWKAIAAPGKWSPKKLNKIVRIIERLAQRNFVSDIAIKIPDSLPDSIAFHQLLGVTNVLAERLKISVDYYTLSEMKNFYCSTEDISKGRLLTSIAKVSPAVVRIYNKIKVGDMYYVRVFEAIGVGVMNNSFRFHC